MDTTKGTPCTVGVVAAAATGGLLIQVIRDDDPTSAPEPTPAPAASSETAVPATIPIRPSEDITRAEAVRFLTQSTFGASQSAVSELVDRNSYDAWIDHQLELPASLTEPYLDGDSWRVPRHMIWWTNVMDGEDQLRQRLAFAWSQVFVVSDNDYVLGNSQTSMCNFYDMLATHSTGNFRELLERVTLHPVMGIYLSMLRNQRADPARNIRPDENYAREVLQLFTIGLHELTDGGEVRLRDGEPITTYDQATVEEFAKLFTGWNYANSTEFDDNRWNDRTTPMVPWEDFHESEAKDLLDGERVPAGGTATDDMSRALDNIFNHTNVGPFIARRLIQRLVTSNPTPDYVRRVAAVFDDDGSGTRGDLTAVTKAVLLDPEARHGHIEMPDRFGKLKEPVLRLSQLWRAFDAQPGDTGLHKPYAATLDSIENIVGQAVMRAPHVFNFYSPDNPLGDGTDLVSPELAILSEIDVASTNNMLFDQASRFHNRYDGPATNVTQINIEAELALAEDPAALVDRIAEILLAGDISEAFRISLTDHVASHPTDDEGLLSRVADALYGVVGSPFHLVQK